MPENIWFEQAFYGSGINGYQVLKNSASQYDALIEKICGAIGTPDGFSKVAPFLINYPHGDKIFMACGVAGPPDRYNRKTLFFHVIYGDAKKSIENNINIFALWRKGLFAGKLPETCGKIAIAPQEQPASVGRAPFIWNKHDLAIQCTSPQNELLEQLLGKEVNQYPWASFSFAPLAGFKLYAISEYAATPLNITCCDTQGNIVQNPNRIQEKKMNDSPRTNPPQYPAGKKSKTAVLLLLLIISVLGNLFLLWQPTTAPTEKTTSSPVKTEVKTVEKIVAVPAPAVDKEKLKKEFIAELAAKFPDDKRIADWNQEISPVWAMWLKDGEDRGQNQYELVQKIKYYIEFTNKLLQK